MSLTFWFHPLHFVAQTSNQPMTSRRWLLKYSTREMELIEYTEQASSNTFDPFKNKHQIDWHLHFVKMSRPLKNQNIVEVIKWARLIS